MAAISKATAEANLAKWVTADLEVATYQSYTIGSRTLTMADADMITRKIKYWRNQVALATREEAGVESLSIRSAKFNHSRR